MNKVLVVCTTDSMIWNFLIPHIKHMESLGINVECACSKTGVYFNELKNQYNIVMNEISFHRSPYNVENVKAYKELKKIVIDKNFDVIFCHEPVGGAIGRLVGMKTKRKVIYMAHGFHFFKGAPKSYWLIYYHVEKLLSRFTDELIVINQEDYDAAKKFWAKDVSLINGIGVDTRKFKKFESDYIREKYELNNDSFIILTVGELIHRKNHASLIKMMNQLNDDKIHLFIAGEGELLKDLNNMVKDFNLEKNIHFLGFCRNINELCNSCDLFMLPSVHEGLSVALMEAMACGKPVIASRIRGNVDLIDDGKGGFLIDTYDINGYANSVIKLYNDNSLIQMFGEYNNSKIKKFDTENVKKQLENIYLKF